VEQSAKIDLFKHLDKVFRFSLSKVGNTEDAEDLFQEILLEIFGSLKRMQKVENLDRWVISVANYTWYRRLRRKYKEPVVYYGIQEDSVPDDRSDITDPLIREEELNALREQLSYLGEGFRKAIILRYFNGKSLAEISNVLKIPVGTVKSRLHNGKKRIERGIEMKREYGEQSYNPRKLMIGITGQTGRFGSPFPFVNNSLMAQNILISAYQKAMTETELSSDLGIAMPYIEEEIIILEKLELLKRLKNKKVRTYFTIGDADSRLDCLALITGYIQKKSKGLLSAIRDRKSDLMQIDSLKHLPEEYIFLLTLICAGTEAVRNTFDRMNMQIPFEDYPIRQFGGKWYVLGYQTDDVHDTEKNARLSPYQSSGPTSSRGDAIRIWDYDCFCSRTHSRYQERFDAEEIGTILKDMHINKKSEFSNKEKEIISLLLELEILAQNRQNYDIQIPIFTATEYDVFKKLLKSITEEEIFDFSELFASIKNRTSGTLPQFLAEQAVFSVQAQTCMLTPAIIKNAMENNLLDLRDEKNYPAMYVVTSTAD
jgi:RNA polymerase sigma factor (sigma-70 family)